MNWKVRMRNPWFWVGIVSAVVSALRVDVNALTSWGAVWACLCGIVSNPVQLATLCLTVLSVFIDPTTAGLGDSGISLSAWTVNEEIFLDWFLKQGVRNITTRKPALALRLRDAK